MSRKKKMLIIDDNTMIRDLFSSDFSEDFEVEAAVDGTQGLKAAVEGRPDVILLDVNMPDISGIEVTRRLSKRPETAAIPVVIITASEYNEDTARELRPYGNFKGFLSKISSSEDIRAVIDRVVR